MNYGGAQQLLGVSRKRFAPDAIGAIYYAVVRFPHLKRTDLAMGAYLLEFDVPGNAAEERMATGGGPPWEYFSIPRIHYATLSKNEKSSVTASVKGTLAFAGLAKQMRRIFASRWNAARRGGLIAADMTVFSDEESEHAAWIARRIANNSKSMAKNEEGGGRKRMVKAKEGF